MAPTPAFSHEIFPRTVPLFTRVAYVLYTVEIIPGRVCIGRFYGVCNPRVCKNKLRRRRQNPLYRYNFIPHYDLISSLLSTKPECSGKPCTLRRTDLQIDQIDYAGYTGEILCRICMRSIGLTQETCVTSCGLHGF